MSTIQEATKEYTALNQYAQKNKVAILGASTAAHLAIGELLDFPMFSYKGIDVGSVYTIDGEYVYTPEIGDRLTRGNYPTPREALELW